MSLIHYDVKPANVLLDRDRVGALLLIISDFGISEVVTSDRVKVQAFKMSQIRGASKMYAAPEVLRQFQDKNDKSTPEVMMARDTFALAITLMQMLKRSNPGSS